MAISLVPPTFDDVYEQQQFVSTLTFYDGVTPVNNISSITVDYQLNGAGPYFSLPTGVTSELITTGTGANAYKEIVLRGRWPQYTLASSWVTQPNSSNTSTASFADYESVVSDGTPYFSARAYNADTTAAVTALIRIRASRWTAALGNFEEIVYPTQALENNWNRKRNQVIPFVQGGDIDAETFRFPGGSLGGAVGQDLPEPGASTGLSLIPINIVYTEGSGTFTVPTDVSSITVRLFGGGGRGGRGYALTDYSASGGGGGSGGFVEFTTSVTAGRQFTWRVGVGGSEANNGIGGATNFGENFAFGGQPGADGFLGQGASTVRGGAGGVPNGLSGDPGSIGRAGTGGIIPDQAGGDGADCIDPNIGQGGDGGDKTVPTGVVGLAGTGFAAGGGGAGTQRGTPQPWAGADGQPGRIEISYLGARFIFVDNVTVNTANYNVRTQALAQGWDGVSALDATITVFAGVYVYSTDTNNPGFGYDNLPVNSFVKLTNNGFIMGKGGNGGVVSNPGRDGGPAIVLNSNPLFITNNGFIAGGGGGGAGGAFAVAGGGGGAGGGDGGGFLGSGGGPGQAGANATGPFGLGGFGGGAGGGGGSTAFVLINPPQGIPAGGNGGGGGRIIPGVGGAGSTAGTNAGGNGGSGTNPGSNTTNEPSGSAGGGGWGAPGGAVRANDPNLIILGGVGGKAIDTRGFDVVLSSVGTIYGAIGGTKVSDSSFSTVLFTNTQNANLRTLTLAAGWNGTATASVTVAGPTYFWSDTTATAGLIVSGSWPNGVTLNNYGKIIGRGGNATAGNNWFNPSFSFVPPQGGGPAMLVSIPNLRLFNSGYIAGGGGGGGGDIYAANGGSGAGGGVNWASQVLTPGSYSGGSPVQYRRTPTSPIITVPAPTLGLGGAIGQAGQPGGIEFISAPAGFEAPPLTYNSFFGGGGGRVLPGAAGIGGNQPGHFVSIFGSGAIENAYIRGLGEGGEAGGGGSGAQESAGAQSGGILVQKLGGNGGAANGVGGNGAPLQTGTTPGGGGGGGWGAAGGSASTPGVPAAVNAGGVGGKSIIASGNTITFLKVGTIWGALS